VIKAIAVLNVIAGVNGSGPGNKTLITTNQSPIPPSSSIEDVKDLSDRLEYNEENCDKVLIIVLLYNVLFGK
jgi:hypothetical protein